MKRVSFSIIAASATAFAPAVPATAQEQGGDPVEILSAWSYDPVYEDGWSVEYMFDETEVQGADGDIIGDVENVVFDNDGRVLGIIAEVGGLWDIGDTHVNIPWEEVSVADGPGRLNVPVTEENVEDYDVFGDYWSDEGLITEELAGTTQPVEDDLAAGPEIFKATDLIGDYVFLSDGARYGYVADLLVRDGEISAIVADAGAYGRGGYFAYPYAYRSDMVTGTRYDLPYAATEIDTVENFDYEQLKSRTE